MKVIMKQELQNSFVYAKKGFLLLELLLAMSILISVLATLTLYQMQTYALYKNAQKRHQALHIADTILETISYTKKIQSTISFEDGITIVVRQVACPLDNFEGEDVCIFIELEVSWQLSSGLREKASFVTYFQGCP